VSSTALASLKFFIDQCCPDSAGKAFESAGYEVIYLREKIAPNSPDSLVAAVAEANRAILVSLDGDFKKIAQRHGVGRRALRTLSLIKLTCRESRANERIRAVPPRVESVGLGFERRGEV